MENEKCFYVYVVMSDTTRVIVDDIRKFCKQQSWSYQYVIHRLIGNECVCYKNMTIHKYDKDTFKMEK